MTPCPGFGVIGFVSSGSCTSRADSGREYARAGFDGDEGNLALVLALGGVRRGFGVRGLEALSHPRRILRLKEIDRVGHSAFGYRTGERCGRCRPRILARVRSESFIIREIRRWAPSNTLGCFLLFEVIDSGDADP